MQRNKCVFLDGDGTLIEDKGYVSKKEDLVFLPEVPSALRRLKEKGYLLVVVSNQSGVARGYYSMRDVYAFHRYLNQRLKEEADIRIDAFFVCPHLPTGTVPTYAVSCGCRKPQSGLIYRAVEKLQIDVRASYLLGDKTSDLQLGCQFPFKGVFQVTEDQPLMTCLRFIE